MKPQHEKQLLWSFAAAPLLALLLAAVLYHLASQDLTAQGRVYEAGNKHLLSLLEHGIEESGISMIVLGNSRLRHALTVGFDPEIPVALPDGRRAAILQFGLDGAGFFNYAGMVDEILALHPDYLVVMPNVLSNRRAAQPFFMDKAVTVSMYLNRRFGGMDRKRQWLYERSYLLDDCYEQFAGKRMAQHLQLLAMRDHHDLSDSNDSLRQARDFLRRAHDAGIKIVMLDLEPNRRLLKEAGVPAHEVDYPGLGYRPAGEDLLPDLHDKIDWLTYYPVEDGSHFCDFMHFNETGRKQFTEWFLSRF